MKGLYKVGDIVNGNSVGYECHAKPIEKVGAIYYTVEGLFYAENEIQLIRETWQPGMNVTAESSHIAEGASSKIANDFIKTMMEQ